MAEPGPEAGKGALEGVVVVNLTRVLGGPYCTQVLGDHGAEVIKIEPPQGDETRDWGPPFHEQDRYASYFMGVNRNKRSIGLDLRGDGGRAVLLRLLERADVLIENYKTGTMERWGLGYEEVLKARFPKLIHCRISGYGATGPLGGRPGYDAAVQACAGMMSVNGTPDSGPLRIGIPLVDIGCGLYAAMGILMALYERDRSGLGQYLDMTLYDAGVALLHPHIPNYALSGKLPGLTGNAHPNIAPYDKFKTKTGEIFLAVGNDRTFQRVCDELGCSELVEDPRFRTNADRIQNRDALREILEDILAGHDGEVICARLLEIGVPAGAVLDVGQVLEHPHTKERAMVIEEEGYKGWGNPIKLSRSTAGLRRRPPRYGAHSREILAEFGFQAAEVEDLLATGVVLEERRK